MILPCNPKCRLRGGTCDGSLDTETNDVVCDFCGDKLENITPIAKNMLKSLGKTIKKIKAKPFSFRCLSCNKNVPVEFDGTKIVGQDCKNLTCEFQISAPMEYAIKTIRKKENKVNDE